MSEALDDPVALAAADPGGMLDAVLGLAGHCLEGYAAGRSVQGLPSGESLETLALCGMGGSGVSGEIVRALYRERLSIPVDVVRGTVLPEHCGKDTLVVCSSYSGGTAETLALFDEAAGRGCRVIAVTSGGELARRAEEVEVPVVPVPVGYRPRAALGHLLVGTLGALEAMGVIPPLGEELDQAAGTLRTLAVDLGPERPMASNEAKRLAVALQDTIPVVWGAEGIGAVAATRWKTELNENAKVPAFAASLPELDHNEVVGWSGRSGEAFTVVALRHEGEPPEVAARFPISLAVATEAGAAREEVWAQEGSDLVRFLSLAMKGGAASVYLAVLRGVDPWPHVNIDRIKRELGEAAT